MLSRWLKGSLVVLLFCGCCLLISCGRQPQTQQSIAPQETTPILKLPSGNSPMATPPNWKYSPYDQLGESASTSFWDVKLSDADFYLDLMPTTDAVRHSQIKVRLKIKNRHRRVLSFTWETFIYEGEERKTSPLDLPTWDARSQPIKRLTLKPGGSVSLELMTREGPAFGIGSNREQPVVMTLVLRITDSEGHSVQVRTPRKRFRTAM